MIFSELYGMYYYTVAEILRETLRRQCDGETLGKREIQELVQQYAFGESIMSIPDALEHGQWQFIKPDGTTTLKQAPKMPLTLLQKQWLNAIARNPRIRLFTDDIFEFPDVEPLFLQEDILVFDRYGDEDLYEDEEYRKHFRMVLYAIKHQIPLLIEQNNRRGQKIQTVILPEYLEYSEKDDKFRVIGKGNKLGNTINLGRILHCEYIANDKMQILDKRNQPRLRSVELEIINQRNSLERVLLHFAHFQKEAEKIGENHYKMKLYYEKEDETEIVIRILSFGPMVRVTAPAHFIQLMKERLMQQYHISLKNRKDK